MSRDIFLGHKVFNINPSSLRSVNFYQELMAERKEYWKERKALLKDDSEAECILCGGGDNELELEYHQYKLFKCNNCSAVFANIRIDDTYTRLVYDNNECKENTKRGLRPTRKDF